MGGEADEGGSRKTWDSFAAAGMRGRVRVNSIWAVFLLTNHTGPGEDHSPLKE